MLSPIYLSITVLLVTPTLSFVLPLNPDLLGTSRNPDPDKFPTLLTSSELSNDDIRINDEASIIRPQTLSSLDLSALTSKNTIELTRISGSSSLTSSAHLLRRAVNPNGGTAILRSIGSSFLAPITLGTQTFNVIVDTGSSDTWLVNSSFTCVNPATNRTVPNGNCQFGGAYDKSKQGSTAGDQFKMINNVNFNVTYGDGEYLTGPFGTIDVTIAGLRVPGQQIALATLAAWQGDGIASGLMGLGLPALTGSYSGSDPRNDRYCYAEQTPSTSNGACNQAGYDPLMINAFFDSQVVTPVFSLALSRDESHSGKGGYLSVGGIPDLQMVNAEGGNNAQFASANLTMITGDDRYRYYLVQVDGVVVRPAGSESSGSGAMRRDVAARRRRPFRLMSTTTTTTKSTTTTRTSKSTSMTTKPRTQTSTTTLPSTTNTTTTVLPSSQPTTYTILPSSQNSSLILDSGTTLSFLPPSETRQILSLYSPPGTYDPSTGFWFVSCTATPPAVGIKIGGRVFYANAKDLVKQYDSLRCIAGVQEASGGLEGLGVGILGDTWLDSVLVVFDFRAADRRGAGAVVRVAARREYAS